MGIRRRFKASPLSDRVAEAQAPKVPRLSPVEAEYGPDGELVGIPGGWTLVSDDGRSGRVRLGKEHGRIRVEDGVLTLHAVRVPGGRKMPDLHYTEDDVVLASPIELNYVGSNRGVALQLAGGSGYLWTDHPAELLALMADSGFATGDTPVVSRGIIG
jgi:hypothetical protein